MNAFQAVQLLADGHSIVSVEAAREICSVLGVQFPEHLVLSWSGCVDAFQKYHFFTADRPGTGVDLLSLSYAVCLQLGLGTPGAGYYGKGKQAQENSRAIAQALSR